MEVNNNPYYPAIKNIRKLEDKLTCSLKKFSIENTSPWKEKFKIPLIKLKIQEKIAEKVNLSYKLKKGSKELLEEAKRRVEEEIEK